MGIHAKLSPSGSGQWFVCPGSIRLGQTVNRSESQNTYADEGTAAHELLEFCLRNGTNPYDAPQESIIVNKVQYPVDIDMRNAVTIAYDYIQGYHSHHKGRLHVEAKVNPGAWMLRDDIFGTADACVTGERRESLIADYKHGKGIAVEVVENTQLLIYALGFALPDFNAETYRLVIIQPRAPHVDGPIRDWIVTREELQSFYERLENHATATDRDDAPRVPGAKQCRFCNAQPICPELAQHNLDIARGEFIAMDNLDMDKPIKTEVVTGLTEKQVAYILDNANLITKWVKAVEEYARAEAEKGRGFPGYKLVRKRSNRRFTVEGDVLINTLRSWGLKIADIYTKKVNGPAPIGKLVKAMKDKEIEQAFKEIVEKPEGGLTLVAESDPRRPVEVQSVMDEFAD